MGFSQKNYFIWGLIFLISCKDGPQAPISKSSKSASTADSSSGDYDEPTKPKVDDGEAAFPDTSSENPEEKVKEIPFASNLSLTNSDKCITLIHDGGNGASLSQKICNKAEYEGVQGFRIKSLGAGSHAFEIVTRFTYNPINYCLSLKGGKIENNASAQIAKCSSSAPDQAWKVLPFSDNVFQIASASDESKCLGLNNGSLILQGCRNDSSQQLTFTDSSKRRDLGKEADSAPDTIKENWFEHNETLYKMYEDKEIVIYGDAEWKANPKPSIHEYTKRAWSYFLKRFGNMGGYRLYAVYHGNGKYSGGHPDSFFNARHQYRNVLDVGGASWPSSGINGGLLDVIVHEMAHIVENQMFGVRGTPGVALWGDNKIYELILYDVYSEMGEIAHRDSSAAKWKNQNVSTNASSAAQPGTRIDGSGAYWFRDWTYPLYKEYGAEKSIVNFFALMAKSFPKNTMKYTKNFNWGEYCHFISGAVGKNQKDRMTQAFGWNDKREAEFQQAKKDYPEIQY